jgi:hypothetical protein
MKWQDRLCWAGLAGLVLWVLRRPVFEGMVLYKRDIHLIWHPQVEAFVRSVVAGSWPVWDPGPGGGQPLLADPSAQIAYPFTWLNLVLRPWTYYTLFAASHVLFSGIGLYLLSRRWSMSRSAAFVASGLWILSGPLLSLLDLWHHLASAAWIPWVLLAADAALEAPGRRSVCLWGAAMAAQILGGSADMTAMTGLLTAGLALVKHVRWRKPLCAENRSMFVAGASAAALAIGLSAILWLPALDVASRSARRSLSAEVRTYWSLHPLSIVETVVPVLWRGLPLRPSLSAAMFEGREPFLASIYLGVPSLVLVCAGIAFSASERRAALAGAGGLALLVALGRNAPFYDWAATLLPPLQILRYPVKATAIVAVCWALLAGLGFDSWRRLGTPSRRRWIATTVAPAALLACLAGAGVWMAQGVGVWGPWILDASTPASPELLARMAKRLAVTAALVTASALIALARLRWSDGRLASACLAILALGDLAALHRNIEPAAPRALYTHRPEIVDLLRKTGRPRVYVYDYSHGVLRAVGDDPDQTRRGPRVLARAPEGWDLEGADAMATQLSLTPATAGRWAIDSALEIDYRGLYAQDLGRISTLLRQVEGTPGHLKLLQVAGVTHVVALHERGFEDLTPEAVIPGLYEAPIRLYRVPRPLPRTYVVGNARAGPGIDDVSLLVDPAFDPWQQVLLPDGRTRPVARSSNGTSRVLERRPDKVRIEADLREEGYVVLLDSYDPGWRVSVDGRESRLLRANFGFRAVQASAGHHTIDFVYRPRALLIGLALSGFSALAALVAGSGRLPRKQRAAAAGSVPGGNRDAA